MTKEAPQLDFLIVERGYSPGGVICILEPVTTTEDNPGRIQIDETRFILPPKDIYHSCDPNAYIDWETMELKAKKSLKSGDTVTYHYGTSEYDYSVGVFRCECGSAHCIGEFRGYKFMNESQRDQIADFISPYLKNLKG